MSRRIQCRALLLVLALSSAHAASPALHAAAASRRPDPSVDRRSPSFNFLLPVLIRYLDRFAPFVRGGDKTTPAAPAVYPLVPVQPPSNEAGPALDPDGKP